MHEKGSNKLKPKTMTVMLFLNKHGNIIYTVYIYIHHK